MIFQFFVNNFLGFIGKPKNNYYQIIKILVFKLFRLLNQKF